MKTHTNNFKNEIKLNGKQLDSKITYTLSSELIELGVDELNSITPHYEGGILKSVMRGLTIDSNVEIPKGTLVNYQFGVLVNGSFEYINFGDYIVDTVEKQEDTNSYLIECCDKMLLTMVDYEPLSITYPITIRNYINAICTHLGLTFKNASDTFANYDKEIPSELYTNIGYTFRSVLDELAQVTASTICINEEDNELEIRYINNTSSVLPKGYTQLDYIESTGTQYIDTGINADYKLSLEIKLTDILNAQKHMGAIRNNGNGTYTRHHFQTKNSNTQGSVVYYVDTSYYRLKNTSEQTNPHIYNIDLYNNTVQFDNEEPITITKTNFDTELNYWLFWRNRNESLGQQDKGNFRIYYCKMYIGNELVRNFIPCYRNSDNEAGLYDLVNDVFYTNQGTGNFTQGNVLLDTIDEEYLKDVNVNFGEKYGPVNSIVLSRAGGSDNIYLKDQASIDLNGLCELKIEDNQIMNLNNRADYLPDILGVLDGFEYYTNDFSSTGVCYYNLCDRYNVKIGENNYSCIMFNDEVDVTQGLVELIHTDMPEESETEYKYASKDDRQRNQAYIIAKKNEAEIQALASKIVDISNVISGTGQIQLENAYKGILHRLEITGNISVLYPSDDLYPSDTLYPLVCNLLVDEALYNLDFEYLNYINANVCDKYVYEDGKQWVERNVGVDQYGEKYALQNTVIEQGEDITILVDKESEISMPAFDNASFKCEYLLENEYTSTFANQVEVTSELNLLGDTLEAKVSQVADDDGNVTSASIILAVNNDTSQAVINADKISLEGKEINLTSDDIIINSTNFNVDKDGNVIMKNSIIELTDENSNKLATLDDQGMKFYKGNQELIRMGNAVIREQDPVLGQIEYNSAITRIKSGQSIDWWRENPMNEGNYLPVLGFYNNDLSSELAIRVPLVINAGMYFSGTVNGTFRFNDITKAGVVTTTSSLDYNNWVSKIVTDGTSLRFVFSTIFGDITVNSAVSDKRLKENIKPSEVKALDKINKIEHVEFNWKESNEHIKNGYIAQQLNDIDEDLAIKNTDEKGLYQVNVLNLLAMTTKAIQEQQEEIELLKQEIKLLKERIDK